MSGGRNVTLLECSLEVDCYCPCVEARLTVALFDSHPAELICEGFSLSEFVSFRSAAALLPLKDLPASIIMIYEGVANTASLIHHLSFSQWSVSHVTFPLINVTPPPRLMITIPIPGATLKAAAAEAAPCWVRYNQAVANYPFTDIKLSPAKRRFARFYLVVGPHQLTFTLHHSSPRKS